MNQYERLMRLSKAARDQGKWLLSIADKMIEARQYSRAETYLAMADAVLRKAEEWIEMAKATRECAECFGLN